MSSKTKAPTQQEINRALQVFIRAAAAGQPINPDVFRLAEQQLEEQAKKESPTQEEIQRALELLQRVDPKERARHKVLADQLDKVHEPMYKLVLDALPESHKELFRHYGMVVLASFAINEKSYRLFQDVYKKVGKILADLEKPSKQSAPKKSAKGGKHV